MTYINYNPSASSSAAIFSAGESTLMEFDAKVKAALATLSNSTNATIQDKLDAYKFLRDLNNPAGPYASIKGISSLQTQLLATVDKELDSQDQFIANLTPHGHDIPIQCNGKAATLLDLIQGALGIGHKTLTIIQNANFVHLTDSSDIMKLAAGVYVFAKGGTPSSNYDFKAASNDVLSAYGFGSRFF